MKIGRNDPCPCGSGKKYKQCCLAKQTEAAQSPDELAWRRVRRAVDELGTTLLKFMLDAYGRVALREAWADFLADGDPELELDPQTPHAAVFFPWLFYRWSPDPYGTQVADPGLHSVPPARSYLQRKRKHLDPLVRGYLEAALEAPLTFHEVLSVEPGRGLRAREFFSGSECWVSEKSASTTLTPGALFFGMLVACEGIVLAEAMSPVVIPTLSKLELLRFKKQYRLDADFSLDRLCGLDLELIQCYLSIVEPLLDPQLPELRNTEGDVLAPQALIYDIDSAEDAFAALHDLQFTTSQAELRNSAQLDADGRIARVEIAWQAAGNPVNAAWDNTLLGRIVISSNRLRAEVNSEARAEKLRSILQARLGSAARYRLTEKESMQSALSESGPAASLRESGAEAELMQHPELQAHLGKMLAAHYENWPEVALPALGGQTPLQAVATAEGRESVAILLEDIERRSALMSGFDPAIITQLKGRLGLS